MLLLGAACLAFCQQTAVRQIKIIPFVLLFLCLLDWWAIDRSLFVYKPAGQVDAQAAPLAEFLSQQTPPFRVYSPSYSLPQQTAARFGLELADGVDPLQLRSSLEFMQRASGVPFSGYSVTLPPFASGDPQTDNQNYLPDAGLLGMLNVRYVLSAFALDAPGLEFRTKQDGVWVYENLDARPRAWVEGASPEVPHHPAELLEWTPNQILLRTEGPGHLLLSEVAYPGWQVWLDGQHVEMQTVYGLLRGVELPAGEHQVRFGFRPLSLWAGLLVASLAWVILFYYWVKKPRAEPDYD